METKRIKIFNVNIDLLSMDETLERISAIIESGKVSQHVVVNVAKLVYAQYNEKLRSIINSCEIINVDGMGVILGAKALGINIPQRVAGIDLMEKLIEYSFEKSYKIYFFGATEQVLSEVIENYTRKYPDLHIAGYKNGYYKKEDEEAIASEIRDSNADILLVAMGSPKKEIFLNKYLDKMNVPLVMGVGGSFDVIAGHTKRAPLWVQKAYLEWFFRLVQEPKRKWKRYAVTNTIFLFMIFIESFKILFGITPHPLEQKNNTIIFPNKIKPQPIEKKEVKLKQYAKF